jgi:uncharacterized protein YkwD
MGLFCVYRPQQNSSQNSSKTLPFTLLLKPANAGKKTVKSRPLCGAKISGPIPHKNIQFPGGTHAMNLSPFKRRACISLLLGASLYLAACGGGGGGDERPPYVPPPAPVEADARPLGSVPEPSYPDEPLRLAAFQRLQQIRLDAGLGVLKQVASLDKAAQDHSRYQVLNSVVSHEEIRDKAGFTWTNAPGRMNHAGYPTEQEGATEVTTGAYGAIGAVNTQLALNLINTLMTGPYHREAILSAMYTDVGVGIFSQGESINLTIDMAKTKANGNTQGAPNNQVIIWPPDKSTGNPTNLVGVESMQGKPTLGPERGYAPSVQTNEQFRVIPNIIKFELRGPGGALVDTEIVDSGTLIAALPRKHLEKNTTYSVVFEGEMLNTYNGKRTAAQKSWTFTTGDKLEY